MKRSVGPAWPMAGRRSWAKVEERQRGPAARRPKPPWVHPSQSLRWGRSGSGAAWGERTMRVEMAETGRAGLLAA
jgi:hypothetical protein